MSLKLVTRFVFSEREHAFTFVIPVCLSVVCRLSRSCTLLRRFKFSAIFLRHLVPWSPFDVPGKFYGDHPRGTPPSGELNIRGVAKYSDFGPIEGYISRKRCKIGGKLLLITNKKSHELSIGTKLGDL